MFHWNLFFKRAAYLEAFVSTGTCEPTTANDRVGNWDVDQFGKCFQFFSTAKCSTFVNHGVSFPYWQTRFLTVPKFWNQVIVPLKGSQHLPTQFADYAKNMDSVWLKESFGMQATEAELVPELASASHRTSQLMHALLWVSDCSHVVGLV